MTQFRRAIADGTFVWLADSIKVAVHSAYMAMSTAYGLVAAVAYKTITNSGERVAVERAKAPIDEAIARLIVARVRSFIALHLPSFERAAAFFVKHQA